MVKDNTKPISKQYTSETFKSTSSKSIDVDLGTASEACPLRKNSRPSADKKKSVLPYQQNITQHSDSSKPIFSADRGCKADGNASRKPNLRPDKQLKGNINKTSSQVASNPLDLHQKNE